METNLVISNIFTISLPPKTAFRFSSALMLRLFSLSWRSCFLMYTHKAFTTSERGIGPLPTTLANSSLICIGFMNAEFVFAITSSYELLPLPQYTPISYEIAILPSFSFSDTNFSSSFDRVIKGKEILNVVPIFSSLSKNTSPPLSST